MTKIVITQGSWGVWTAEHVNGWDKQEVKDLDREQAMLRLLAEMGIEVVYEGEYWLNGQSKAWQISNMKKGD